MATGTGTQRQEDVQSIIDRPNASANTIGARLLRTRKQVASMVGKEGRPSTVLHPFYQETDESQCSRQQIHAFVQQARDALQTFLQDAGREDGVATLPGALTPVPNPKQEDNMQTKSIDEAKSTEAGKQSQSRRMQLVSLLREQSTHAQSLCQVLDRLEEVRKDTDVFPPALAICALAEVDGEQWPTEQADVALHGLKLLVRAFEEIAKGLRLESFAEESTAGGNEASGEHRAYTLTLAARILVIDADIWLQRKGMTWAPVTRIRISYATDSSGTTSGMEHGRSPDLAEVLQADMQAISDMAFGTKQNTDLRETARAHLSRLRTTVRALKRLDDLSSHVRIAGMPDLFSLMDDLCSRLSAEVRSWKLQTGQDECQVVGHHCQPYATLVYHTTMESKTSGEELRHQLGRQTLERKEGSIQLYTLRVDIATSSMMPSGIVKGESGGELPEITSSLQDTAMWYVARLDPPLAMQQWMLRRLAKAAGVHDEDDKGHSRLLYSHGRFDEGSPIWLEDLIKVNDARAEPTTLCFAPRSAADTAELQALLVSHFPFASLRHLRDAIAVLKQQAQLNDILAAVHMPRTRQSSGREVHSRADAKEVVDGMSKSLLRKAFVSLSKADETDDACITIDVALGIGAWNLNADMVWTAAGWTLMASAIDYDNNSAIVVKDDEKTAITAPLLANFNGEGRRETLPKVVSKLLDWGRATVEQDRQSKTEDRTSVPNKRRASEAGISDEGPPKNKPRS